MAERRDATGVDVVRGLMLSRVARDGLASETLTDRDDWLAALRDVVGLRLDGLGPDALDPLWTRVVAAHEAWEAAGRP
jgi:hypothetical protein